ncbi:hypothetical protein ABOM_008445 [Aspergillus bombycis]|uniref:DNA2/NAM7 helicase-like C-terminal domain-containing protein n=1 Tax=Aspergillus bombycis TaxID=109264 RepID=A0A1F7ZT92_9EURO|nr:hypothetical protein ABOM_008445 [Aspergillus bombycis]OGM42671.1 hypothetical protein ABOM_008445 [Aspergillus bombycis]
MQWVLHRVLALSGAADATDEELDPYSDMCFGLASFKTDEEDTGWDTEEAMEGEEDVRDTHGVHEGESDAVLGIREAPSQAMGKQSELVCQALRGDKFALSKGESAYINLNRDAINNEADEEHKCLGVRGCQVKSVAVADRILFGIWPKEERPFRLYRGCTLVLRGEEWFNKEKGKDHQIPGEKCLPEDWMASVTETSPKWRGLIDAPVHAVLLNQVDIKLIGEVEEDDVKVHQVASPMVQMQMLNATRKLSEHWGEESFDAMCREFEKQEATIPSGSNKKLPLKSMFLKAPGKYRKFLDGIEDIKTSGRVKRKFKVFSKQRQDFNPEFVIFDEASFFRDPEIVYILGQLKNDARVLFVGRDGMGDPFERLINKKYHQTLLNISYRSHKILYRPTSVAYYDGQVEALHAAPRVDAGIHPKNPLVVRQGNRTWTLPGLSHFLHLAHVEGDTKKDLSGSLFHPTEAEIGVALARSLVDRGCREILIMSPYRAQVALVKKLWEQRHPDAAPCPKVQTVDASQGSEAEAVIVLITRNFGSASFLQSVKRTNVMLSRACTAQYLDEADHALDQKVNFYTVIPIVW